MPKALPDCATGRSRAVGRVSMGQLQDLDQVVEEGPKIERDKLVRWRCGDLKDLIKTRFAVDLSERSIARLLKQRRFARLSVRPQHPKSDVEAQEAFKKTSPPA